MKFGYTILYVSDVTRSVEFYERAFGLQRRFIHESGTYAELNTGTTTLAFALNDLARSHLPYDFRLNSPTEPPAGFEIGLITDDVPAAYQRAVAAGAAPVTPPTVQPWGQTVSYVRDLNGILVEICTAMG